MADRTHLSLTVFDCPAAQAQAVLDLIEQKGLHLEFDEPGQPSDDQLGLGMGYMDHEVTCGSADEIAAHLQQLAPDASWEVHEDPAHEWLGSLYRFTPSLGLFASDCGPDGQALFTPSAIQPMAYLPNTLDEPGLARALGETHREALEELAKQNADVLVDPE